MQANAINCIDYIIENFPVRIREVWTDNSHEFKAKFQWQVEDLGIRRVYIKCAMPQWNRTASSSGPTILISRNSTSCSVTKATSIGTPNSTSGNGSTTLPDCRVRTTVKHLIKLSETSYYGTIVVPQVSKGYTAPQFVA